MSEIDSGQQHIYYQLDFGRSQIPAAFRLLVAENGKMDMQYMLYYSSIYY